MGRYCKGAANERQECAGVLSAGRDLGRLLGLGLLIFGLGLVNV